MRSCNNPMLVLELLAMQKLMLVLTCHSSGPHVSSETIKINDIHTMSRGPTSYQL
jgi:hypothetical protein